MYSIYITTTAELFQSIAFINYMTLKGHIIEIYHNDFIFQKLVKITIAGFDFPAERGLQAGMNMYTTRDRSYLIQTYQRVHIPVLMCIMI